MYNIKGELKVIGEVQQISDSFKKRTFVVVDASGQYEQTIELQLVQDRCAVLDNFVVGAMVDVTFFLRGREWTNPKDGAIRYFNTLDAWTIKAIGEAPEAETKATDEPPF
tara:strand:- start:317 stop:646 length:330 start_codon:yes stop_codon:yes gene_type:complete